MGHQEARKQSPGVGLEKLRFGGWDGVGSDEGASMIKKPALSSYSIVHREKRIATICTGRWSHPKTKLRI